jgi:phosphoribosylaminoimidazolecarboxamide formyltransferase/IMP cyclohydrolase
VSTVQRALISVTDKTGIVEFARGLVRLGVEILSTGGTRRVLVEAGVPAIEVAEFTGSPEFFGGRVKTLHPKVHGGILFRRDHAADAAEAATIGIQPIDLVAVNLYAFEEAARKPGLAPEAVIEEIDIGGPTLLRSAAKNHAFVLPVVDPGDYPRVLEALAAPGGADAALRQSLAFKVFRHTARYDQAVAGYLASLVEPAQVSAPVKKASDLVSTSESVDLPAPAIFPDVLELELRKLQDLRYGENPHQAAALYADGSRPPAALAGARQLAGKALSFNNLLDADAALGLMLDLRGSSAVFVKHNNPCGAAIGPDLATAVKAARACDPISAFGAVVALGQPVDRAAAEALIESFLEVVVAPGFSLEALELLAAKKNLRLVDVGDFGSGGDRGHELRRVRGGFLAQTPDDNLSCREEVLRARVVTQRVPTDEEREALSFAWVVAKHVRSNAIVFGTRDRILAVGAGQMSRVDSVEICRGKGKELLRGSAVASDAFFPFRDGVDLLAQAGATAVVQPGGSVRDPEVIAAADEHGLAMLMTGVRHFRH